MKMKLITTSFAILVTSGANAVLVTDYNLYARSGDVALVNDSAFMTNATASGTDDPANLNNSSVDPTLTFDLETFVGINPGDFLTAGRDVTEGSAMKVTFSVLAGDIVSFGWQYLTNDTAGDFAFVVLDGAFSELADNTTAILPGSNGYTNSVSGVYVSTPFLSDSTVTLAFGVADTNDFSVSSAFSVPSIVPEPSAIAILGLGLAGFTARRRRA